MQKLYCYVDETGQDTKGELFLVAVVLKHAADIAKFRQILEDIEDKSGKHKRKWTKTPNFIKLKYLRMILEQNKLRNSIFYSVYHQTKEYTSLVSLTIAKSVLSQKLDDYSATIIIDGLNDSEVDQTRRELKNLNIHYSKIRGMRDEQDALLRLADCMAGFIRDYAEKEAYTVSLFEEFSHAKIVREI